MNDQILVKVMLILNLSLEDLGRRNDWQIHGQINGHKYNLHHRFDRTIALIVIQSGAKKRISEVRRIILDLYYFFGVKNKSRRRFIVRIFPEIDDRIRTPDLAGCQDSASCGGSVWTTFFRHA